MARRTIHITGNDLRPADIRALTRDDRMVVGVSDASHVTAARARDVLEHALTSEIIYGVNTGFGPMASHLIGRKALTDLQYNLIRSHAVGMGAPLPPEFSLAAMAVRLNTLSRGYSGVTPALLHHLEMFINRRIIPVIPEHGAVGTSGDLVQLAHIALALIGEGEVFMDGSRISARDALKAAGIAPYALTPKEGLSLINGTSVMTGISALGCTDAQRLVSLAIRSGAWALELIRSFDDGFSEQLQRFRPHRGQVAVAQAIRDLVATSRLIRKRGTLQKKHRITDKTYVIPEDVQEIYSFRCLPQIVGPALDTLLDVHQTVRIEMNSVTDNPIVDPARGVFLHGGNFHGEYIAAAADRLKAAMTKLAMLSERRINFFLNDHLNRRLPPFLNLRRPGLTLALQGLQFVATSTAAHNQSLAYPHHLHSIPTNEDNQDVVSMGTDAALIAMRVIENAYLVLAVELVVLAQATDVTGTRRRLSEPAQELFALVRERMPAVTDDRVLIYELPAVVSLAKEHASLPLRWYLKNETELL